MASNDESVWAVPSIQCPSCGYSMDLSGQKIGKLSKKQREDLRKQNLYGTTTSSRESNEDSEMRPSEAAEHTFVVVSCGNHRCEQYNRFKVLRIPKLETPVVKVSLE